MSRPYVCALIVVACIIPGALLAQTGGAITASTEPSDSLTEVVVTAQRRFERLQDVPLTVTAVSGETLAAAGVTNIQDLNLVVPGLSVNNEVGFAITHLRGVGSTAIGPGIENPVAVYVDGVYYASAQSSLFDFLNVDNVEVLKGPQGTLFGRNATGGLIQITTAEPTQATRVDVDLGLANYQTGKADLYVAGGMTTDLAADIAVQVGGAGEGYGRNFYNGAEVYRNDLAFDSRSKWVWTPSDATKITAAFDFSKTHDSEAPQPVVPGASNLPVLAAYPATNGSVYNISQNEQPLNKNQSGGASVRFDQQLAVFNLMDIVAFRRADSQTNFDLDNTPISTQNIFAHSDDNQFSEELQLSSRTSSANRWTAGFYYFHSGGQYDPATAEFGQLFFYPAPPTVYPFATLVTMGDQTATSYAGYGQATFPLGADTSLTTGIRYTDETHSLRGSIAFFDPSEASIAPLNATYPSVSDTFKAPTYRIALDHHITSDFLIYASWNTGFKSGGFNTQFYTDGPFQPEKLFAYEVGAKSEFLNRKVRVNVAAFHDKYKNIQVQYVHGPAQVSSMAQVPHCMVSTSTPRPRSRPLFPSRRLQNTCMRDMTLSRAHRALTQILRSPSLHLDVTSRGTVCLMRPKSSLRWRAII